MRFRLSSETGSSFEYFFRFAGFIGHSLLTVETFSGFEHPSEQSWDLEAA
jgi:hypothetical protein